ncbi:MFS transporter [Cumulibacter manganitolerans]|uniref:MFS transporter n=1 Tax=Cumulibacter manganitolerans TaxID=1884992 RepID=UPI00129534D9|nr:MFS transporter [Cumulibacter manganitolerans]
MGPARSGPRLHVAADDDEHRDQLLQARHPILSRIFRERPAAAWVRASPRAHWIAVATVCAGAFMGQLDASIVSLALPAMQKGFQESVSAVQWVALSYLLTLVALVAPIGRFSDWLGRKAVYVYGFAVFTIASLLCTLAPSLYVLIAFRVLQALGAAMLQANSVALIATAVPRELLTKAIGIQGAAQAIGLALGPTVGGLLVGVGDWRLIFAVNVPVGLVAIVAGWYLLPRSTSLTAPGRLDGRGLALFLPSILLGMLALSLVADHGIDRVWIIVTALVSVVCAGLLIRHSRRTPDPAINVALFSSRPFAVGIGSGLLSYAVLFGVLFAVPMAMARTQSAVTTGLVLTSLPVILALVAPAAGYLSDRAGPRLVTGTGMLVAAAGLVLIALEGDALWGLVSGLAVLGIGSGLFTPANNASIMASAPRAQAGAASGTLNMTRGLGTALGIATATLIVGSNGQSALAVDRLPVAMLVFAAWALIAGVLCLGSRTPRSLAT